MNIETAKNFFLWCTLINYTILLLWCSVFYFAHDWHYGLAKLWFREVSVRQYDNVNFAGIAFYKISIILLCLVPYIATCIISP